MAGSDAVDKQKLVKDFCSATAATEDVVRTFQPCLRTLAIC